MQECCVISAELKIRLIQRLRNCELPRVVSRLHGLNGQLCRRSSSVGQRVLHINAPTGSSLLPRTSGTNMHRGFVNKAPFEQQACYKF